MGGDYTRFGFKPEHDYAALLRQQGRVGLDSDHNELMELLDRRWRAETLDVVGQCAAPSSRVDASGVPTAFEITPRDVTLADGTASVSFGIGVGRLYVDGMLIECRGSGTVEEYDPNLGESRLADPVPYEQQPYYPQPDPLNPAAARTDLIYVDVFQREVSTVEEPALLDEALGGADTTTRLKTVWQVKVKTGVTGDECADVTQFGDPPSGGHLTTKTDPTFVPADEPCTIPPAGGFRGLENRLYRVEIHQTGGVGGASPAKFKWSRDNASVNAAVDAMTATTSGTGTSQTNIQVRQLGRDQVLRFRPNDWIEVLDDHTEYAQAAGQMTQIQKIDESARLLTVEPAVDLTKFDLTVIGDPVKDRHVRVRRWDQTPTAPAPGVTPTGLLDVTAGDIAIEDGILVSFALDPGTQFRIGDHWVFWARTAQGDIELLDTARPRGIRHHYGKLALIQWGTNAASTRVLADCRTLWPPKGGEACCTVVVHPGEDIQDAIDSLPPQGGCVCLKTGVHPISQALRIRGSNVVLHGESPGTIVRHSAGPLMLSVASDADATIDSVRVEGIRFEATQDGTGVPSASAEMIHLHRVAGGALRNCFVGAAAAARMVQSLGLLVTDCSRLLVEGIETENLAAGVFVVRGGGVQLRGNRLRGPTKDGADGSPESIGLWGILFDDQVVGPCSIEQNLVENYQLAIWLGAASEGSVIAGNRALRTGTTVSKGLALGFAFGAGVATMMETAVAIVPIEFGQEVFAIHTAAPDCLIADNFVNLSAPIHAGIRIVASGVRAQRNWIRSDVPVLPAPAVSQTLGILVDSALAGQLLQDCVITSNTIMGAQRAVVISRGARIQVIGNSIEGLANQVGAFSGLLNLDIAALDPSTTTAIPPTILNYAAILADRLNDGLIAANRIGAALTGILLLGGERTRITENHIADGLLGVAAISGGPRGAPIISPIVAGNVLTGFPISGVHLDHVTGGRVEQNAVRNTSLFGIDLSGGVGNRVLSNVVVDGARGISAVMETDLAIAGNLVQRMKAPGITCSGCIGIASCAQNRVEWCGYLGEPGVGKTGVKLGAIAIPSWKIGWGILFGLGAAANTVIDSCEVIGTGRSGPEEGATVFSGATIDVAVSGFSERGLIRSNVVVGAEGLTAGEMHAPLVVGFASDTEVLDNFLVGTGTTLVILVSLGGDVTFSHNRCEHNVPLGLVPPPVPGPVATWRATTAYGLGDEVFDGTNVERCVVAGTSGSSLPPWTRVLCDTTGDGGVLWRNQGPLAPAPAHATVVLSGRFFSVLGNQIRTTIDRTVMSFSISPLLSATPPGPCPSAYLSAVGNVTTGQWFVSGSISQKPQPVENFNHIGVS
jgi:uncharacterized protein DUF6519